MILNRQARKARRHSRHTKPGSESHCVPFPQSPLEEGGRNVFPPHSEWMSCPDGKAFAETTALLKTGHFILI